MYSSHAQSLNFVSPIQHETRTFDEVLATPQLLLNSVERPRTHKTKPVKALSVAILSALLTGAAFGQGLPEAPPICKALDSPPVAEASATPSPEIDVALEHWNSRAKYFLVVSATRSAIAGANLDFAKVNADFVANKLQERGYQQLSEPLTGEQATRDNFVVALQKINQVPDNGLVVVYYTGHGVKSDDDRELWLQLFGEHLGAGFGISVTDLISNARGASYSGDLIIVIDSCFSGHGTLSSLTGRQLDKTIIVTSSNEIQTSRILTFEDGSQASAFTFYLMEALTSNWDNADFDRDGIFEYGELLTYMGLRLNCAKITKKIDGPMTPKPFIFSDERFFAYDHSKVRNWHSPLRQLLASQQLLAELKNVDGGSFQTETVSGLASSASSPPSGGSTVALVTNFSAQNLPASKRALALASLIQENTDDPFARSLKLIAEGRASEAILLLGDPKQQSVGNLENLYLALGLAQRYSGKYPEAIESFKKGLSLSKANKDLLDETAHTLSLQTKYKDAVKFFQQSIAVTSRTLGSDHPELANTLEKYEEVLRKANQIEKADKIAVQVAAIRMKVGIQ